MNSRLGFLLAFYALSGLVGLAYEVLWVRLLAVQFGVSVLGVVVTVAAFMTGLGGGSLWMRRRAAALAAPLRTLAWLEAAVALFALVLPALAHAAQPLLDQAALWWSLPAWQGLIAGSAFAVLTLPALALGAGFPLVLQTSQRWNVPLGWLYGINTLGAVLGALLPLGLLPTLGWSLALRSTAGLGLLCALGWVWMAQWAQPPKPVTLPETPPELPPKTPETQLSARLLGSYGMLGGVSLMLEIAWTRLFGLILLRTEYVLALILAVFLFGIGVGSTLVARHPKIRWLEVLPWMAGGGVLLGLALVPALSAWVERSQYHSLGAALGVDALALLALTLPTTGALGAWLPLLARQQPHSGVQLYGVNALGGALGALAGGFLIIPWLGTTGTLVACALLLTGLGLYWARPRRWIWLLPAGGLLVAGTFLWPMPPASALLPQALGGSQDVFRYEDAIAMTQVVQTPDGQRLLLTDLQRRDASTDPTAVYVQANQSRLPLLLHPDPHSVLFEGLGTGISVAGSAPFPQLQRSAVELSRGAILAAQTWFAPLNQPALGQTRIWQDDARHFLAAHGQQVDVIIGDLFHPDLAGVSSLLSVQQFQRARRRLNPGGLFVQWIALNQFDWTTLQIVLRSFKQVYPDAQLFLDGMHLALVGPQGDWGGASALHSHLAHLTAEQRTLTTAHEGEWTWLGRYWGPIPDSQGPVQDEWAPQIEFLLPRLHAVRETSLTQELTELLKRRPGVEQAQRLLGISQAQGPEFQRSYMGTELLVRSWVADLSGQPAQAQRLVGLAFEANPRDRWILFAFSDRLLQRLSQSSLEDGLRRQALQKLLQFNPEQPDVLRALWQVQRRLQDPQAESTRQSLLQLVPLDREAGRAKN